MKTRTKRTSALIGAVVLIVLFAVFFTIKGKRNGAPSPPVSSAPPPSWDSAPSPPVSSAPPPSWDSAPSPPVSSAPPPPPEDTFGIIDRILEKLEFGNIAFNAPRSINLEDTAIIQLMLGLAMPTNELKEMIKAEGEKEGARIRVSNRMEARLSGPNFAITAITPETQAVTRRDVTEWKWEVKPRTKGRQHLHLTLSVLISVDGASTQRSIRTFDKEIEVEVTWNQQVLSFFEKNWQWLWAAILLPIFGWLWKKKKESKPNIRESDS